MKALGFSGKDIVRIFVTEAIVIGFIGIVVGLGLAVVLINLMSNMWVGGDIGFFPIRVFPKYFGIGVVFGLVVTFLAGYLPARKVAGLDPISIFRK
ncbi:MAG: FtsX-like permease family protein [Emticicia sp.]|nr:FtsX-like permease family protein [Emticicia sp.]